MAKEKGVSVATFWGGLVSDYLETHSLEKYGLPDHLKKWEGVLADVK